MNKPKKDFPKIKERLSKQYKQPKKPSQIMCCPITQLRNDRHYTDAKRLSCLEDINVQDMAKIVNYFNKKIPKALIFSDAEANDIKDVLNRKLSQGNYPVKSLGMYEYQTNQHLVLYLMSLNMPCSHGEVMHHPTMNYQDIYTNEIIGMALKAPLQNIKNPTGLGLYCVFKCLSLSYSPSLIGYLQGDQDPQTFKLKEAAFFESMCQSLPDITPYHNTLINTLNTQNESFFNPRTIHHTSL